MKYSTQITALSLLAAEVVAFPSNVFHREMSEEQERSINQLAANIEAEAKNRRAGIPLAPGFSTAQQYVSTTGEHAFVAPGPTDLRGPCPGLNAMANHGYIPHNGVATIPEFIQGTYDGKSTTVSHLHILTSHSLWYGNRSRCLSCHLWGCL